MAGNTFFGNIGRSGQPVALFAGYDPSFRVMRPGMSGFSTAMRGFAGPQIGRSGFGNDATPSAAQSYYNGQLVDDANSGSSASAGGSDTGTSITDIITGATNAAKAAANIYTATTGVGAAGAQMTGKPMTGTPAPYRAPARSSWVIPTVIAIGIGAGVVWYMKKR